MQGNETASAHPFMPGERKNDFEGISEGFTECYPVKSNQVPVLSFPALPL
jgi:hypothetical protein